MRLRHHARRLRILNGFSFRRHRRTIDTQGARPRIACRNGVQGRDILEPLGLLHWLIQDGGLLRKLLHPLCGERLARACSGHRIAVDGAIGRVRGRGGECTGRGGACDWGIDGDRICERRCGRDRRLGACAEERGGQAGAVGRRLGRVSSTGADADAGSELVEGWKAVGRRGPVYP